MEDDKTELQTDGTLTDEEKEAARKAGIEIPGEEAPEEPNTEDSEESDDSDDGRPSWLPEQYENEEAFAEAHKNLLTKVTEQGAELNRLKKGGKSDDDDSGNPVEEVAGLFSKAETEFSEKGTVSEETLAELASVIPQEYVDRYFSMMGTVSEFQSTQVFALVGGQEEYAELVSWADANLSEAEKNAFDSAVSGSNFEIAKLAVEGLAAKAGKVVAKDAKAPAKKYTGKGAPSGVQAFQSEAEMVKAINDPRYAEDPAYRKGVQERIAKMHT